jgi:hypothetical protein
MSEQPSKIQLDYDDLGRRLARLLGIDPEKDNQLEFRVLRDGSVRVVKLQPPVSSENTAPA